MHWEKHHWVKCIGQNVDWEKGFGKNAEPDMCDQPTKGIIQ